MTKREVLVKMVEERFSDNVRPADEEDEIFESRDPGVRDFMKFINGKDWKDFLAYLQTGKFSKVQYFGGMISFMTPKAFHYFTPSLLIAVLTADISQLADTFFSRLMPRPDDEVGRIDRILDTYSEQQKSVIALVVEQYAHFTPPFGSRIDEDLYQYWKPMLPQKGGVRNKRM